jgi:hypothetical protein
MGRCIGLYLHFFFRQYQMKNAVVIGGTKGIGLNIALQLVSHKGYSNVVITGRQLSKDVVLPKEISFVEMDLSHHDLASSFGKVKNIVGNSLEALFVVAATGGEGSGKEQILGFLLNCNQTKREVGSSHCQRSYGLVSDQRCWSRSRSATARPSFAERENAFALQRNVANGIHRR